MSKAKRIAILEEINDRLSFQLEVAAWLRDVACGNIKIPKENFDVAVADHAAGLKQAHRLAKSL